MSPTAQSALLPMPPYPEIELDVRPLDTTGATRVEVPTASEQGAGLALCADVIVSTVRIKCRWQSGITGASFIITIIAVNFHNNHSRSAMANKQEPKYWYDERWQHRKRHQGLMEH
jgi:hypothetical protein